MEQALELLNRVFGYPSFRGRQAEVIAHAEQGGSCLVLMPTGGGKSLCYQILGQRELGLSMLRDRKQNAVEILDGVAGFAAIVVRGGGELTGVDVLVAVHTVCKLHFVKGRLAGGEVALRAFHLAVFACEGVARGGMLLDSKQ